ncbi:prepilin-type N-terminal cleavage/methylation domain-containing protein [Pengzhenrongella phosphoraccumulans]|uniref:prepilin-type N-terminal cleavage/methylation domain-containing protein n=1 Tax=Pengzhenrongella phosphoraccumulans TaxID=3114394 RepID=UPI003890F9B7
MMARIRKSLDEKEKGFTLIELLVVIIIIGILAAIAIPVFLNQRKKAVDASIKSDLRTVATELETFYTDNQKYPVVGNVAITDGSVVITGGSTFTTTKGNVLTYKPLTGNAFCVLGKNPNGTDGSAAADLGFQYLSAAGGLSATKIAACA